ncbi:MAG: IMPACT family protein, partial [Lentisphaeria bacterium]
EPIKSKNEALEFIDLIKLMHPTARHHCWAYIIGNPNNTSEIGMTDDGEPHGTAGRPMLGVLQNNNVGDVAVVVVRYFGGTLLGTGGLVRAYSNGVIGALEKTKLVQKITQIKIQVSLAFALESAFRRFLQQQNVAIEQVTYSQQVIFTLIFPLDQLSRVKDEIIDFTHGQAGIIILEEIN